MSVARPRKDCVENAAFQGCYALTIVQCQGAHPSGPDSLQNVVLSKKQGSSQKTLADWPVGLSSPPVRLRDAQGLRGLVSFRQEPSQTYSLLRPPQQAYQLDASTRRESNLFECPKGQPSSGTKLLHIVSN